MINAGRGDDFKKFASASFIKAPHIADFMSK